MPEIIPNWHPILAHLTVALLATAAGLYGLSVVAPRSSVWAATCLTVAKWNLWLGTIITVATIAAGFYAYATVVHDTPSHAAMTVHRNWALATAAAFGLLAVLTFLRRRNVKPSRSLAVMLLGAGVLLGVTGWKGGELVYRYGMGVMSLPDANNHRHASGAKSGYGRHLHPASSSHKMRRTRFHHHGDSSHQ